MQAVTDDACRMASAFSPMSQAAQVTCQRRVAKHGARAMQAHGVPIRISRHPRPCCSSTDAPSSSSEHAVKENTALAGSILVVTPLMTSLLAPGQAIAAEAAAASSSGSVSSIFEAVEAYAAGNGPAGVAVFVLAYAVATVLLVPGSVLTLAAGAIYGPVAGTAVVSAASTMGALAAFLVARTAARPWVEDKLQGYPKARAVVSGVSKEGARLVLLLRLSPLVPFTLLNYAMGLTEVSVVDYTLASWAGMLPGTFAYVYLGGAGRAAIDAASTGGVEPSKLALWGVGAAATLLATKLISNAASKAIDAAAE